MRVLRRAIPLFQQVTTPTLPLFVSWLIEEMLEQEIPPRQGRTNPPVVKKRTATQPRAEDATSVACLLRRLSEETSALGRSKKPRSKFKSKKRSHRSGTIQLQPLTLAPVPSAAYKLAIAIIKKL